MKSPKQKTNKQINQNYMETMIAAATIGYHNSGLNWKDALDKAFTEHEDLAEKESTIEALEEALAAVKYFVNKTITNGTVVFKDASGTDITTALTTLTTGVAKGTVVTGTITPSEGYRVTGVTVNGTAVTVTEDAFTFTLDNNKAIVITLDIIQP